MATSPKRTKFESDGNDEEKSNIEEVDSEIQDLDVMDLFQSQLDEIEDECNEEMYQIESKYDVRRHEIYLKRSDIIKKIPNFWKLTVSFLSYKFILLR